MRKHAQSFSLYLRRQGLKDYFQKTAYITPRQRQPYSIVVSPKTDTVNINVGSNGTIALSIHHPLHPSISNPTILHLPSGPLLEHTRTPPRTLSSLSLASNATVVDLHYRLSTQHLFPTPVHDVLAGYDWILKHLLRGSAAPNAWQSPPSKIAGLAVCGELTGGSLAAMLALTECHVGKPGIRAAVMGNPITDWTAFHNSADVDGLPPSIRQGNDPATSLSTSSNLLHARSSLFSKPSHYFDPFASPLLFFRTPSSDLPPDFPASSTFDPQLPPSPASDSQPSSETPIEWIKKRRAHRRHPPLHSTLRLPTIRVDVGTASATREQGWELVELWRRSVDLYEGGGRGGRGRDVAGGVDRAGEGEARAEVREKDGVGLWTEEDLVEIGGWLARVLR